MKRKLQWAVLAACGVTALALAGCGGGCGDEDDSDGWDNSDSWICSDSWDDDDWDDWDDGDWDGDDSWDSGNGWDSGNDWDDDDDQATDTTVTGSLQSVWFGAGTNGSREQSARLVILDDGTLWGLVVSGSDPMRIGNYQSVLHGSATANGNSVSASFTQFDVFNASPQSGTLFSGSFVDSSDLNLAFSSGLSVPVQSDARYASAATLSALAGSYDGRYLIWGNNSFRQTRPTSLTVSGSTLSVPADSDGCTASGTLAPRASMNVFNLSLTYSGASCALGNGTTVNGVAYPVGESKTLEVIATTPDGKSAVFFDGFPQR